LQEEAKKMKSSSKIIRVKQPIKEVVVIPSDSGDFTADGEYARSFDDYGDNFNEESILHNKIIQISEIEFQQTLEQQYLKGFQEGKKQGFQEATANLQPSIEQLENLLSSLQESIPEIISQSEEVLLQLVFSMVRRIIPTLSEHQEQLITHTLKNILREAQLEGKIKILINPADMQTVQEMREQFRKQLPDISDIFIVEDSTISRGGCLIETGLGKLDGRIETQLNELENQLKKLFQKL